MSVRNNTIWNLLGSASPMLIGVVSVPYLLQNIGIEKLGVLTMVWALIGYFSVFDFGLGRALTHKIASLRLQGQVSALRSSTKFGLFLMFLTGMVGTFIVLIMLNIGGVEWLNFSKEIYDDAFIAMIVAAVSIPITTITSGLKGVLEGFEEFKTVNFLRFLLGLSNFLSPVLSVYLYGPNLTYIVLFLIASRLMVMLLHVFEVWKLLPDEKRGGYNHKDDRKDLFRFGAWMTVSNVVSPLMVVADRFIISHVVGATMVAYYTVPSEFLLRLLLVPAALTAALFPVFTQKICVDLEKTKLLYWRSLKAIALVMFPVLVIIAFGSHFGLSVWLGADFADQAYVVVIILSAGILFNSLAQIPHSIIQANGNVKLTSLIHLAEFILYVPMLFIFLYKFGIIGAAVTWVLRALIDLTVLHVFARSRVGV